MVGWRIGRRSSCCGTGARDFPDRAEVILDLVPAVVAEQSAALVTLLAVNVADRPPPPLTLDVDQIRMLTHSPTPSTASTWHPQSAHGAPANTDRINPTT